MVGVGGAYLAFVVLNVGAQKHYMLLCQLLSINICAVMIQECKYEASEKFSHPAEQSTYNRTIWTGMRYAQC